MSPCLFNFVWKTKKILFGRLETYLHFQSITLFVVWFCLKNNSYFDLYLILLHCESVYYTVQKKKKLKCKVWKEEISLSRLLYGNLYFRIFTFKEIYLLLCKRIKLRFHTVLYCEIFKDAIHLLFKISKGYKF